MTDIASGATSQGQPANPLDQTREQVYAGKVYGHVVAFRNEHPKQDDRDTYKSMVQSLPVLVRTAGLAQALAFVATRKDDAQKHVLSDLDELLKQDLGGGSLIDRSRAAPLSEYMYLTRQVMSALLWYKRYAEWLLDKDSAPPSTAIQAAATIPEGAQ